jgi:hypothetical protein
MGMKLYYLITATIALMMVTSGLGLLTVGSNNDIDDNESLNTVQRVVFAEDFTNHGCGPCVAHNEAWTGAIEAKGYGMVAPAYTHTMGPSTNDPFFSYGDMPKCSSLRSARLGISTVPNAWLDGLPESEGQTQAYYETQIDARASIPANISITTSGYLNPTTRFGYLSIHAETVEDLLPGDYRLMVFIWENNVSRDNPLTGTIEPPYLNGEMEMDWGVWLMLPDEQGKKIWTDGVTSGATVDVVRTFTAEPDWVIDELGATVFIQNYDNLLVEQAAVDLFDDPVPSNDLLVEGKDIVDNYYTNKPTNVDCYLHNGGSSTETGLTVDLKVDGGVVLSEPVASIAPGASQVVNFLCIPPSTPGLYELGFEVTTVPGEIYLLNNLWIKMVNVLDWADMWVSPGSYDLTVVQDQVVTDELIIGNTGTIGLDWESILIGNQQEIKLNEFTLYGDSAEIYNYGTLAQDLSGWTFYWQEQRVGQFQGTYDFPDDYILDAHSFVILHEKWGTDTDNELYVGHHMYWSNMWNGFAGAILNDTGLGVDYFKTDSTPDPIPPGTNWFPPNITHPITNNVGRRINDIDTDSGDDWVVGGTATPLTLNPGQTGIGTAPEPWLSLDIENGIVPALTGQTSVTLTINASGLTPGDYQITIGVRSNDPDHIVYRIPVNITVTPASAYNIVIPGFAGPWPDWRFISFPIGISGDVETILDDTVFGDSQTTWDAIQMYDAVTGEWKSFAKDKPAALNTLQTLDNTMGLWVHVTGNGGDSMLSTGLTGAFPGTSVNINLYTGWNLVGFPTASAHLPSATLPPEADLMAVYNDGEPYKIEDQPVSTPVFMLHGRAYWVRVTADCIWQVDL